MRSGLRRILIKALYAGTMEKTSAPVQFNEQKILAWSEVQHIITMSSFSSHILTSIIHT